MVQWPNTGLDSLPKPGPTTKRNDPGFELATVISDQATIIENIEAKLGSTVTGTPGRGKALIGKGADAGVWDTFKRRNKLLNGAMRVAQRTTLGTTDNTYTLDRWRILLEAANAAAAAQETSDVPSDGSRRAIRLTVGSGEDNKFGIFQPLEFQDVADLRGKQVSLQAKLKVTAAITDVRMALVEWTGGTDLVSGDPISSWGTAGTNPTLAASWAYLGTPTNLSPTTSWVTYYSEALTVGGSAINLAVLVWCEDETTTVTTDVLRITDVQLEEGAVCTAFERVRYGEELDACKRYYEEVGGQNGLEAVASGLSFSTTQANAVVNYEPKRAAPSVGVSSAGHWAVVNGSGALQTCTALVGASIGLARAFLTATVASGLTAGQATYLLANSTSAARITLDAEL